MTPMESGDQAVEPPVPMPEITPVPVRRIYGSTVFSYVASLFNGLDGLDGRMGRRSTDSTPGWLGRHSSRPRWKHEDHEPYVDLSPLDITRRR